MPGTLVILNDTVDLPRPADHAPPVGSGRVSTSVHLTIHNPDGSVTRGRFDHVDLAPGQYRVRASWGGFHTNRAVVDVSDGGRHYVRLSATGCYSLTQLPAIGALPALIGSMVPGSVVRLAPAQL